MVGLLATMSPEVFVSFQHRQCAKTYSKILQIYTVWLLACERVCLCMFLCVCVCFCVPMFVFVLPVRREILTWKGISEMIKFDFPTEEFQSDCFWLNVPQRQKIYFKYSSIKLIHKLYFKRTLKMDFNCILQKYIRIVFGALPPCYSLEVTWHTWSLKLNRRKKDDIRKWTSRTCNKSLNFPQFSIILENFFLWS